ALSHGLLFTHGETGDAVVTTAGMLPARYVIHAVGPVWSAHSPEEATALLTSCYRRSLDLALAKGCRSVAFPNISTGVYQFPKTLAADTALAAVRGWVEEHAGTIERVSFVCFDDENHRLYAVRLEV
ncbi:MAG: macro domain-containing protein, partial [Acidimicrobiia bacterium]